MSYLATIGEAQAAGAVARMYEKDRAAKGYVSNYAKTFSPRPAVYTAWQELSGAVSSGMDLRRYEVATLAAARKLSAASSAPCWRQPAPSLITRTRRRCRHRSAIC